MRDRNKNPGFRFLLILSLAGTLSAASGRPVSAKADGARPIAGAEAQHDGRAGYVGDDACRKCHADQVNSYHQTAHYLTSMEPSAGSIPGDFTSGNNVMKTGNPELSYRMDERGAGGNPSFYETAVEGADPHTSSRTERIAIVVGSGAKGQTYLYWSNDRLFELPVSLWEKMWVNSPGYRDGIANFGREVIPRCLECHATYFEAIPPLHNKYRTTGYTLGIQCEVCHGPGREHVASEEAKHVPTAGSGILNPARFSRDRQMDLCAWCHAGLGETLLPSFSYRPGEALAKYVWIPPPDLNAPPDVHGNQVGRLELSQCFRSSNMTCTTCHDVHATQHDLAYFSRKCLICHKPDSATFARPGHPVTDNCIDCHMPEQKTNLIVFDQDVKTMRAQFRNHWIKVYPGM